MILQRKSPKNLKNLIIIVLKKTANISIIIKQKIEKKILNLRRNINQNERKNPNTKRSIITIRIKIEVEVKATIRVVVAVETKENQMIIIISILKNQKNLRRLRASFHLNRLMYHQVNLIRNDFEHV